MIAPDAERRPKFQKIVSSAASYEKALGAAVEASEEGHTHAEAVAAVAACDASAGQLHENAEDGRLPDGTQPGLRRTISPVPAARPCGFAWASRFWDCWWVAQ